MHLTTPLNVIPEPKGTPLFLVFLNQFRSFLTALLFLAVLVSFLFGDYLEGILILFILLVNAGIGFFQEIKAKRDVLALKKMEVSFARVVSNGKEEEIDAKFLQIGDVVILEAGDKVPADGEILHCSNLTVSEAIISGESAPVLKEVGEEVLMATVVLTGRAKFRVTRIGISTNFGKIAKDLEAVSEERTPLEIKISKLSRLIGVGAMCLIGLICLIGVAQGESLYDTFFSGVALAVAAVPEGLPAVLTVALAVGVRRLAQRKTIVKRLSATEALGSVDVIVTDKTGTLTENEMRVKEIVTFGSEDDLLKTFVLCNSAAISSGKILGDTTEGALLLFAKEKGVDYEKLRSEFPLSGEIPFDAKTRLMTVFVGNEKLVKGAVEKVVEGAKNLTDVEKQKFHSRAKKMASDGLRVLGFSKNDCFLGLCGIYDAPRSEVFESIGLCKKAGIRVVMATGDFSETARAIGLEIGLFEEGEGILTGEQLGKLSDEDLKENLMKVRIFARVTPADKLRIVEAFQSLGKIVSVTGDGVNDAPALKRAEVGVAMGISGTDVSKEAADLVITDDNFATIVSAIEEGRVIFANLLKSIKFLLASNLGEVLTVIGAVLLGLPMPLTPLALLWINVVSDGLPAVSLAVDAKEKGAFFRKPKQPDLRDVWGLGIVGILVALGTLVTFWIFLPKGTEVARLAAFSTIVFLDLLVVFVVRGRGQKFFANKLLLASVLLTVLVQIVIVSTPQIRQIFV